MELTQECISILGLSSIKGLGLKTFYKLLHHFRDVDEIVNADQQTLLSLGLNASIAREIGELRVGQYSTTLSARIEQVRAWQSKEGNSVISIGDACYPYRLKQTYQPPPLLYLRGSLLTLDKPSLAIVGSRKASLNGLRHAEEFARVLAQSGINVISGLALGIDTAAHQGALSVGGLTSAVLGTGIDVIYPRQNRKLAESIVNEGIIISEMPLGTMPLPANFPRRNRIVSGLADGVLVVEATEKSGSLITSKFALEQNRDVFSIPGPIESPSSAGTNNLIKQGALLVSSPDEIISSLSLKLDIGALNHEQSDQQVLDDETPLNENENALYQLISCSTTSFDFLIEYSTLEPAKLSQELMMLELKGLIASVAGGYQRVKHINSRAV